MYSVVILMGSSEAVSFLYPCAFKLIPVPRVTRVLLLVVLGTLTMTCSRAPRDRLQLDSGDSVVFIGNTFAERMHLFGYFETLLYSVYPDHHLKVRNLGWSADEVALRPRPKGFGDLHGYLLQARADVVFVCFGMNESFAGSEGLERFQEGLDTLIEDLQSHRYNSRSAPKIVLLSPIAHEDPGGKLPDGTEHNPSLQLYTDAMAGAARRYGLVFVDLFRPTQEMHGTGRSLTFNGVHLSEYGYWNVSQMVARSLGLVERIDPPVEGNPRAEALRRAIYEKNYYFFIRWRGPNSEYIHGERNGMPGADNLPQEMEEFDKIIEAYDQRIWEMAKPDPEQVWQQVPSGLPAWFPTPEYEDAPAGQTEPTSYEGARMLTATEALRTLRVPRGYSVNLFASEENFPLANPMAVSFDARGRLWVANTPTWPQPIPGQQPTDSIIILEDTDRDGVADRHTVFIDKLNMIHGFTLGGGGAYISQTPHLIHAEDADGDDRADRLRMLLHGFGSEDVEHSMNNFRWGPGGAFYFMEGIFLHSQVETPYGPRRLRNAGVFRYRPRSHRLEVAVSYPFWNPWGEVFDDWGQHIILDASSGDYYNLDILSANFVYPKDKQRKGSSDPLSFAPKSTGPSAGIDLIRNHHFPEAAQGRLVVNELAERRATLWYQLEENGSSNTVTRVHPDLLGSSDPFFRPIAMTFGPDGALYVVDFYSPVIENTSFAKRHPGRDHSRGRIWRITYNANPSLEPPQIVGQSASVLLDLLKTYDDTTRHFARRELQERNTAEVIPELRKWVIALDPTRPRYEHHLVEALWIYQGLDVVEPELLKELLRARDHRARAAATRVLRFWQERIDGSIQLLKQLVEDEHPRVRLQAILACGFSSSRQAPEIALQAAKHPMDPGLKKALDDTMDFFERARRQ